MPAGETAVARESELKVIPAGSLGIKLMASRRGDSAELVTQVLANAFQLAGYRISHLKRALILDEYLDDRALVLFRTNRALRVRRKDGFVTVRFSPGEQEWQIDEPAYDAQLANGFERFKSAIKDIAERSLKIRLKVTNERDLYHMTGNGEDYELAVNVFSFTNSLTGVTSPQQLEVEIEARNDQARTGLPNIKANLLNLGAKTVRFSTEAKYQRGVQVLGLARPQWVQRFSAWTSGADARILNLSVGVVGIIVGAMIGVMGIVLGILLLL